MSTQENSAPTQGQRMFPILGSKHIKSVPWALAEKCRTQAMTNHGQTLERLAERGGLSPEEFWCACHGRRWNDVGRVSAVAAEQWLWVQTQQPAAPAAQAVPQWVINTLQSWANPTHMAFDPQDAKRMLAALEHLGSTDDPVDLFMAEVRAELTRARAKFPGDRIMTIALAEEFGELCKAVLDENAANVRKEAVQTAVMAARVALDGDGSVREWRAAKGLDQIGGAA